MKVSKYLMLSMIAGLFVSSEMQAMIAEQPATAIALAAEKAAELSAAILYFKATKLANGQYQIQNKSFTELKNKSYTPAQLINLYEMEIAQQSFHPIYERPVRAVGEPVTLPNPAVVAAAAKATQTYQTAINAAKNKAQVDAAYSTAVHNADMISYNQGSTYEAVAAYNTTVAEYTKIRDAAYRKLNIALPVTPKPLQHINPLEEIAETVLTPIQIAAQKKLNTTINQATASLNKTANKILSQYPLIQARQQAFTKETNALDLAAKQFHSPSKTEQDYETSYLQYEIAKLKAELAYKDELIYLLANPQFQIQQTAYEKAIEPAQQQFYSIQSKAENEYRKLFPQEYMVHAESAAEKATGAK